MASDLPILYTRWARELLGAEPPRESRATCLDCAMVPAPDAARSAALHFYDTRVKCCTYTPVLPNFLAGGILTDESPEQAHGRASLLERVAARERVTPLGVGRPDAVNAAYGALAPEHFGTEVSLRCPHLTPDALCGIWRHRNAVCATWFCKHERGAAGERFWSHLRELLRVIERELALWCLLETGWPLKAVARLLSPPLRAAARQPAVVGDSTDQDWGDWEDHAAEFFIECWRKVEPLAWHDVARICGATANARARLTTAMFRRLEDQHVPDHLVAAPLHFVERRPAASVLLTYRGSDPLEIDDDALRVVNAFDGRPTADVLQELLEHEGLDVDLDLVRLLRDFDVLRDPTDR